MTTKHSLKHSFIAFTLIYFLIYLKMTAFHLPVKCKHKKASMHELQDYIFFLIFYSNSFCNRYLYDFCLDVISDVPFMYLATLFSKHPLFFITRYRTHPENVLSSEVTF